jgi:hypothetical protein
VEELSKNSDKTGASDALLSSLTKLLCDAIDEENKQPESTEDQAPSKPKILTATFARGKLSVERRDS